MIKKKKICFFKKRCMLVKFFRKILILTMSVLFFISFGSCRKNEQQQTEEIFSLTIGYGINDAGLISSKIKNSHIPLNFVYKNGFYYISDSVNNKILKLTGFGEPILTIFNEDNYKNMTDYKNVESSVKNDMTDDRVFVKLYKEYKLVNPGLISVDINKNIYVVNKDNNLSISEDQSIKNELIVKFDKNGNMQYFIGREGKGLTPFGCIMRMHNDIDDNLIVVESVDSGIQIYMYSPKGELLQKALITAGMIPVVKEEKNYIVDIINYFPGYQAGEVYITCQFISENEGALSLKNYITEYEKIYQYSLTTSKFEKLIIKVLPEYMHINDYDKNKMVTNLYGGKTKILKPFKNLIGIDKNYKIFLNQKENPLKSYNDISLKLTVYQPNGRVDVDKIITYPPECDYYSDMILSDDGKLFSYYVIDDKIYFIKIL